MKRRRLYGFLMLFLAGMAMICLYQPKESASISAGYTSPLSDEHWDGLIADKTNETEISLEVDGKKVDLSEFPLWMNQKRQIQIPLPLLHEVFQCSVRLYDQKNLTVEKNRESIETSLNSDIVKTSQGEVLIPNALSRENGEYYLSAAAIQSGLSYDMSWNQQSCTLVMNRIHPDESVLPTSFDGRAAKNAPAVRDQGASEGCWAFAATETLSAILLPEEDLVFSVDHMIYQNHSGIPVELGGEYTMSMAYLLSWEGPVLEADDPFGDGISNASLEAVKHVQEVQILPKKDLNAMKLAIYEYGGIQSSVYFDLTSLTMESETYRPETASYCYIGFQKVNHDLLVLGWDDNYPKENFKVCPEGDGAFLCMNSWGTAFGEDGFFWVSYYDSNIGIYNIVYSDIEEASNYDHIYQSDEAGWTGQLGYGMETASFANVYTSPGEEVLEAVGFYAVGENTSYEVYFVPDFSDKASLKREDLVAEGSVSYEGFYTIPIETRDLRAGETFAVLVTITTPGAGKPVAVEYASADGIQSELSDGEGYISNSGQLWQSTERTQSCNVCLKAYTQDKEERVRK